MSRSPKVLTRPPRTFDREAFVRASQASIELHSPWVQPPYTPDDFDRYLQRFERSDHESRLVLTSAGDLVGVINLNNIIGGYFQNAFLGFYAFAAHAGTGLMREGFRLVIREAFEELDLHRLEANIQPGNLPSLRFVQRAGFRKEGLSPRYLRINGTWCDHERWALLREDWSPQA